MIILKIQAAEIFYLAKILTIQVKKKETNDIKIWESWKFSDENVMLGDFRDWFLEEKDKILIGYNILKFDLPLLLLRLSSLEKFSEFFLKLNRSNVLDLFVVLTFLKKGNIKSFDYYCQKYNITTVPQEKILDFYHTKNYSQMDKAISKNLSAFAELFDRILKKNA